MHDRPTYERLCVNVSWLIQLRWVAVVGQMCTIAIVHFVLRVDIQTIPLSTLVLVTAVSNLLLSRWWVATRRRSGHRTMESGIGCGPESSPSRAAKPAGWEFQLNDVSVGDVSRLLVGISCGVMLLDLLNLTALLYYSGGPTNPFALFYLVNLGLAAIVLPARWAWALSGLAVVCMGLLFCGHIAVEPLIPIEQVVTPYDLGQFSLAAQGLFVAFVTCSSVVVYFTTRLTAELRRRESELRRAELLRARGEKLEALGTLAAGAAHELATPLSTIAVVAKEVERELNGRDVPGPVIEDMQVIRKELDRCRGILDRMSIESGQAVGEPLVQITGSELLHAVADSFDEQSVVDAHCSQSAAERKISAPLQGLAQALRGIVQNAVDVVSGEAPVRVSVDAGDSHLIVTVQDEGRGMTPELLQRAGDPFFTTKEPGKGMGMGLFLARSVIERLGGTIDIQSTVGVGTTVRVVIPFSERT